MKALKISVPHATHFFCCVWDTRFLKPFISSASQTMKEETFPKTIGQIPPSKNRLKFLYQIASIGTGTFQSCDNLDL